MNLIFAAFCIVAGLYFAVRLTAFALILKNKFERFKRMERKNEVAFMGEIGEATCECHKGKTVAVAFFLHPKLGRVPIASKHFDTIEDAEKGMEPFLMAEADRVLSGAGLRRDQAASVTVRHDDAALGEERRFNAENNPHLH